MSEPCVIHPRAQLGEADCAVMALSMFLGCGYPEIAQVVSDMAPWALTRGMYMTEMQRVARRFGVLLIITRRFNLDEDTGLLILDLEDGSHVVVLFQGVIVNPGDGLVWDTESYLKKAAAKPRSLLKVKEP